MRRISFAIFALFVLITIGANSFVQASGMYTESISINGTNDFKYEYNINRWRSQIFGCVTCVVHKIDNFSNDGKN